MKPQSWRTRSKGSFSRLWTLRQDEFVEDGGGYLYLSDDESQLVILRQKKDTLSLTSEEKEKYEYLRLRHAI